MHSPFSLRSGILASLHALLAEEYALYAATRAASQTATGPGRLALETQMRRLDADLMRVAWQLGSRGDCAQIGPPGAAPSRGAGPAALRHLENLHEELIRQLNRFAARINRLGDPSLDELLGDLRVGHMQAAYALRDRLHAA